MLQKNLLIAFSIFFLGLGQADGQSEATSKGANLVSGLFSFTSRSGDLYVGNRFNSLAFTSSYYRFVADRIGVGGDISISRRWADIDNFNFTNFGIGPKFGYFFDNGSNTIPFAGAAINYSYSGGSGGNRNGYTTKLGGGILVRIGHVGFSFEAGWLRESFKFSGSSFISGNTIFVGAGLAAFLFKG